MTNKIILSFSLINYSIPTLPFFPSLLSLTPILLLYKIFISYVFIIRDKVKKKKRKKKKEKHAIHFENTREF